MEEAKIFIVEDDALVLSHLQQILQDFNYQIIGMAASGEDAISQIEKTRPDLVLMDIRIRGPLNGIETAKIITQNQKVPIIFLTAHANSEYLKQAQVDNAFSYLLKPIRSIDLHTNIQMALFKHKVQRRLNTVNQLLQIRQKLNHFILEKTTREELLSQIGEILVKSNVFSMSMVITDMQLNQPRYYYYPKTAVEALEVKKLISQKKIPFCIKKALTSTKVIAFKKDMERCYPCPLVEKSSDDYHFAYHLTYRDRRYGVLFTSLNKEFQPDNEIIELFQELSDDVAYALHKFELEGMQQKAQKALEESEYKYRILSENALLGVFLVQDSKFKYVNPQMAKIFNYDNPNEILKLKSFLDLCHPENHKLIKSIFQKILEHKDTPFHIEFKGKDKNGKRIEIELLASHIEYQGKSAVLGSLLDITEKKEKEQIIRLLSAGIEESPVLILITDIDGKIEYVNPAFCKVTGFEKQEILGKKPSILKSGEMPEEFYQQMWQNIKAGQNWSDEIINRKKDGSLFWAQMLITPIKDEKGQITHFLAIQEDITEKRRLERQLVQSQKMEAIGRLAGGVAHDFNNLLTVINGYAQLLLYTFKENNEHRKKIEQIFQAGEKAKNLVSQLLAFSRKQMRNVQNINLNSVIEGYYPMIQSLIGENIIVEKQLTTNLWLIESDQHQIEQILLNLIVNAKQAMPEGGKLSIISRNVFLDQDFVQENDGARTGEFVQLTIADTGMGMDQETLKHIFEPFFTTRGVGEGTGLGLATVYGIVKQNDGLIYVTSAPNRGTIFEIYFPRARNQEKQLQQVQQENEEELFGDASILLVEDDLEVRKLTARELAYFGFRVETARNGKEALQKLNNSPQKFDLVITDLVMPVLSGKRLAELIKQKFPHLPILFISGYDETEFDSTQKSELPNFLQKPYSPIDLAKKVKSILNK